MHELLLPAGLSRSEALARCQRYLAGRIRRWRLARPFLPAQEREDLVGLLAWQLLCREIADSDSGFGRRRALDELQSELEAALTERARSPVGLALAFVVRRHELPEELLRRPLLEWRRDEHLATFDTRESLLAHARAVAVPEGRLLLGVLGAANPRSEALADSLSIAIQLSAWLAHLGQDLERGRLRLPVDELTRNGVEIQSLLGREDPPNLARVIASEVAWARTFFARGWELCRELGPWRGRRLAFVLRWHAASLTALEAARFELGAPRPAGWPRLIACASASLVATTPPRLS